MIDVPEEGKDDGALGHVSVRLQDDNVLTFVSEHL
jgi:hypothetical protein